MGWNLTKMSRYVLQSKLLDQLKQNDELCVSKFDKASFLMFFQGKPLLTQSPKGKGRLSILWSTLSEMDAYSEDVKNTSVLLGIDDNSDEDVPLFACPVNTEDSIGGRTGRFSDMRRAIMSLTAKEAGIVSRGYSLLRWHETVLFCATCASPMNRNQSGTMKSCSKPCSSGKNVYPTTHPVAITRVVNNSGDQILLARQPTHPRGMFTCVAGFMETGESVEDCVRREVAEEVGIVIDEIKYFNSQTWPLHQNTLMLGFTAKAMPGSDEINMDKLELEEARWFSKEEIKAAFERVKKDPMIFTKNEEGNLIVPPRGAIAYYLIKDWLQS